MCGLFGAIARNNARINEAYLRSLAIVNRERGTHALGFFRSDGRHWKHSGDPLNILPEVELTDWLDTACRKSWFVAGHTRFATRGRKTVKNAHPFRYGRFIGSHNGVVDAPRKYAVDSMYLIDRLKQCEGDYQSAFADIGGYWSLTWFDGASLYLQCHDNMLAHVVIDGVVYYSSDADHLHACTGRLPTDMANGETVRWDIKSREELPRFESHVPRRAVAWPFDAFDFYDYEPLRDDSPSDCPSELILDNLAREAGYCDLAHFMDDWGLTDTMEAESLLHRNGYSYRDFLDGDLLDEEETCAD